MPVLNEATIVVDSLSRLRRDFADCELLVVDGGSTDGTASLASPFARVITSAAGRGGQLNAGAAQATGEVLWFVHADTAPDPAALSQIHHALKDSQVAGGGLTLRFDASNLGLRYLSWTSNARARRLHWIFGDQAMFVRRGVFDALGGFAELPLMEDLEFSRRLVRRGRLVVVPATSTASARRFAEHGVWRMVAFMQWLKVLYFVGVDPAEIALRYARGPRLSRSLRAIGEQAARAPGL